MFPTEEEWMQRARQLYQETRDLGKELVEIRLAKALMDAYVDGAEEINASVTLAKTPAMGSTQ